MDWLDLLAVRGTLKSLLRHHSSKASILHHSAFFIVQLSHPYVTTGKTINLTRWIFVGKVISLLFNMLSRLVITFLPRSKCLLISWLKSPSAVILEPPKIKSATVSTVSPSVCHEVVGLDATVLVFWIYYTIIYYLVVINMGFSGGSDGKESTCSVGDLSSTPGLGRSPGGGQGNPLQYSCLENPHGQRSLVGYSPWGSQRGRHNWATKHSRQW